MENISNNLSGAITGTLILLLLNQEQNYGYQLAKRLVEISDNKLNRKVSSLYPLLKKYEKNGFIKSDWDMNDGRPIKRYQILKKGRVEMENQINELKSLLDILNKLYSH